MRSRRVGGTSGGVGRVLMGGLVLAAATLGVALVDSGPSAGLSSPSSVSVSPATVYLPAVTGYSAPVSATVRDSSGAPVANFPVSWTSSSSATFSSAATVTDANGVASTRVQSSNGWGKQTITATAGTAKGTATLVEYGCAQAPTFTLQPPAVPASGPLSSTAHVTVTDNNSPPDPMPGRTLTFTSSGNDTVGAVTDNGDGTYSAPVTAYGPGTQTISVTVANGCSATSSATMDVYGAATAIAVSVNRSSFPATGQPQPAPNVLHIPDPHNQMPASYDPEPAVPTATATVTDAEGDRVPAENVTFSSTGGVTFGPVTDNGDGTYSAQMISSSVPGPATVTATDTGAAVTSAGVTVQQSFGALHTTGSQVLDANNRPVFFRGVNLYPSAPDPYLVNEFPEPPFYDSAASTWGANFARASLDLDQWMQSCPTGHPDGASTSTNTGYDSYYKTAFTEYVRAATERGMFVLLGLFNVPRVLCDPGGSHAQIMAVRDVSNPNDDSLSFWQSVASQFKDNPLVGFELYNEPHLTASNIPSSATGETPDNVWLNGGTVTDGSLTWTVAGMQQMYDAVRAKAPNNLVFVDGPSWANQTPPYLISSSASATHGSDAPASNIVYVVHAYTCPNPAPATSSNPVACSGSITPPNPGDSCPTTDPPPAWDDPQQILQPWVTWRNANDLPIMEDEFGWPSHVNPVDSCFDQTTVSFDEANAIPWSAFLWIRYESPWSVAFYPDYTPTISGAPIKQAMAANATETY